MYADRAAGGKVDTIVIVIPPDSPATASARTTASPRASAGLTANETITSSPAKTVYLADTSHRVAVRTGGPGPDNQVPVAGTTAGLGQAGGSHPDTAQKHPPVKAPLPFVNSDCHDFANDYDVDKLRVKMLESAKDDDRIQAARKVFRSKCFSTRQIRALSEVFTTDATKFRFFETAYPFAADDHFRELGNTLTDPVYSGKFKAMTGQ